jgi:hypothetical protein
MIRKFLLALCVVLPLWECGPVPDGNQKLNQFCERNANCAPGLTCVPDLTNVCFSTNDTCLTTVSGSACCDKPHECGGVCCPVDCVPHMITGGVDIMICPSPAVGSPAPVGTSPVGTSAPVGAN